MSSTDLAALIVAIIGILLVGAITSYLLRPRHR
jgi:hypothetical protein